MSLPTPYYEQDGITIYHGEALDILPLIEPGSVDAVVTDPPYGLGLAEWDRAPDMPNLLSDLSRLGPEFVSVFCQMPFLLDVARAAQDVRWHYCEHISWVKRNTTPSARLSRSHESILIYAPGKSRRFYETRGPYEDVRVPGVLVDVVALESVRRNIGFLRQLVESGRHGSSHGAQGTRALKHLDAIHGPDKRNGQTNFTNVWSFLPPNSRNRPGPNDPLLHVSIKPVDVCQRLVEMTCRRDGLVLDPYMGTGTTLVAARQSGRDAIGVEVNEQFCEIAAKRLQQAVLPMFAEAAS